MKQEIEQIEISFVIYETICTFTKLHKQYLLTHWQIYEHVLHKDYLHLFINFELTFLHKTLKSKFRIYQTDLKLGRQ